MTETVRLPSFEGDFELPEEFALASGEALRGARLRYAVYGAMDEARSNVVLVCHALSGSARVGEWWPFLWEMVGLVDAARDAVVCVNVLGSCYGSTGPASIDSATGKPYGASFPLVQIEDVVRAEALLLDSLGVERVKLAIGPSLGGMQAIEWAVRYPARVAKVVAMGVAPLGAMGLALNHLQRQTIMLDPDWRGGGYGVEAPPRRGLALARGLAVCSYKSEALFVERFGRKPDRSGEDPWGPGAQTRFDVAGYLDYQGRLFIDRFDANSYLAITRMMDLFDPARAHGTAAEAWGRIEAEVVMVGITSDWLFPAKEVRALASAMQRAGVRCRYQEMVSEHGHDAFLAEPKLLIAVLESEGWVQVRLA